MFDLCLDSTFHGPSNDINCAFWRLVKDLQVDREELAQRCHRLAQENKDGLDSGVDAWSCSKHIVKNPCVQRRTGVVGSEWQVGGLQFAWTHKM